MANAWNEGSWSESGFGGIETATITLTGLEASGALGSLATQTDNNFEVTGVSAVGALGEEFAIGNQVWGGGTWNGDVGWGGITTATVELTGFEVSATLGSVAIQSSNTVQVTGLSATGELGESEGLGNSAWGGGVWGGNIGWGGVTFVDVSVTGVEASGVLGVVTEVIGGTNVVLTGVLGTGELGEEDVSGKATAVVTGVQATGVLGTVTTSGKAVVDVTGVVGTIALGTVTQRTANRINVSGVSGTGLLGEVEIQGDAVVVLVTGVVGTGQISRPLVWGLIDTSQTPNWLPIAA